MIVFLGQVSEHDVLQRIIPAITEHIGGLAVGQMSGAGCDALFENFRIRAGAEQFFVVIAFDNGDRRLAEGFVQLGRNFAEVGRDGHHLLSAVNLVSDGFGSVMRDIERADGERADVDGDAVHREGFLFAHEARGDCGKRSGRRVHGNRNFLQQTVQSACVVAMLVREKDRVDVLRVFSGVLQRGEQAANAKTGIDENPCAVVTQEQGVGFGAGSEDDDLQI